MLSLKEIHSECTETQKIRGKNHLRKKGEEEREIIYLKDIKLLKKNVFPYSIISASFHKLSMSVKI